MLLALLTRVPIMPGHATYTVAVTSGSRSIVISWLLRSGLRMHSTFQGLECLLRWGQ